MHQQARTFEIPLDEVALDGLEPDRDIALIAWWVSARLLR
jgi:hypothetical protein